MSGSGEKTVRFAGFGGQGIVKSGEIFGAAAILDGKSTLQNQAYGSSARGGLCTSDVTVSDSEIYDIEPDRFDILMILSQDSCDAFLHDVKSGGILIVEEDLVQLPEDFQGTVHASPATRIAAQDLGRRIVTNMVVLGYLGALSGLVDRESLEKIIVANVPPGTDILNLQAFALGWERGEG
jgi:2-oxoglutarate ferredoxin oxidoreductase subunit gamma